MSRVHIPDKVHQELLNWSRYCWLGEYPHPTPSTRCGSAEGAFHAEWHIGDEIEEPRIKPNVKHAVIVQQAWEGLPDAPRKVLRAEYPARRETGRIDGKGVAAARLGMLPRDYDTHLSYAIHKVEEAFSAVRI